MPRWVEPPSTQPPGPSREGWITRIVKFVPTEIVATFTLILTTLSTIPGEPLVRQLIATGFIALFFGLTYLYVALRIPAGKVKTAHFVISPFAFLAWAYPICSGMLGEWFNGFAAASLQGVVLAMSIFFPTEETAGAGQPAFT